MIGSPDLEFVLGLLNNSDFISELPTTGKLAEAVYKEIHHDSTLPYKRKTTEKRELIRLKNQTEIIINFVIQYIIQIKTIYGYTDKQINK
ncbi:hypothetical protein BpHYR1_053690 [Brachionus plicatilis]|uniref:Uncharacterized protein n=1 Tax=Brachionus plicatilis TaxID=10195 RepID=A0A3M7PLZ7_BRAPC|nr:hypothetical protein BpHYR1_053690 [Brachionus plicatilis]